MPIKGRKIKFFARGLWPSSSKGSYRATPAVSVGPRFFAVSSKDFHSVAFHD